MHFLYQWTPHRAGKSFFRPRGLGMRGVFAVFRVRISNLIQHSETGRRKGNAGITLPLTRSLFGVPAIRPA